MNPKTIPQELKARDRWVVWTVEIREGKETKVPYQPRNPKRMASSTNLDTWGTFEQALSVAKTNGFRGVGYVFSSQDEYSGVDLDKCRNPETGEIEPEARSIIDRLGSYTEVSPSGGGVHIIIRAKLPPGSRRKGKIEMYDSGRYFTMTGHHLESTPTSIEDRQGEIEALHKEVFGAHEKPVAATTRPTPTLVDLSDFALIDKAKAATNGHKFFALWDGDTSEYSDDDNRADLALCSMLAFYTGPDPGRIDQLFRQSGLYREKWNRQDYRDRTIAKALEGMTGFYQGPRSAPGPEASRPKAEASQQATDPGKGNGAQAPPLKATTTGGYSFSDLGNCRRLVAQHGHDLHYCHLSKKWWVWTGKVWAVDTSGEVRRRAKAAIASIYGEAAAADEDSRKKIAAHALRSEHDSRIRGMLSLAESERGIPISPGQLDANPWLLNCLNGTVELKTGKLRPHDRADLLTRLAPVEFDPAATCPRWEKFLDRIQESNHGVISFIQRILGYALTGDCREQCLFLLWGSGANGKSTLLAIISAILGNYAMQTPTETLLAGRNDGIPNDIARLNGPRFVTALEVSQGRRLAEPLVKQLTGQDTIAARFLFGEYFDFKPQFKLFLGTNHKPVIKDTSHAMWRRIRLIPFNVTIPDDEQDKALPDALLGEAPGILAWAVRGCLSWQHGGLGVPDEVTAATGGYQAEQDTLGEFFSECCIISPRASVTAKELYQAFGEWAENSGEKRPLSQRAFGMSLTERGFERTRGTGGKGIWWGIGLKGVVREVREVTHNPRYSYEIPL